MKASEEVLGTKSIGSLIVMMALPSILAQLVNLLYSVVDRIYIGNMAGDIGRYALAGLGLCTPITVFISAVAGFVAGGGAPLASRALGAGHKERAQKILGNGFSLLLIFSVVLGLIAFFVRKPLLYAIGASDVTYPYANEYLSYYLIGTAFVQIALGLNNFISGQGRSRIAMLCVITGAVLNIGLDPLFIFVFDMGIKGAAIATVVAQGVSSLLTMTILMNKKTSLRLEMKYAKIEWNVIADIFKIGCAPFVMAATESIIGFVLNGQLQRYGGDDYVSTLTILQSCMMLVTVPISGFTQGVTPILSYNFGAKKKDRLLKCYLITLITCFSYCCLFAILMMSMPRLFGRIFTSSEALLDLTQQYLRVFIAGMLIFGVQRACQTTFVAVGEAKTALFIACLRKIILLVPLALILPLWMGVGGVYYAECIADATAATICGTIFLLRYKKILKRMEMEEEA